MKKFKSPWVAPFSLFVLLGFLAPIALGHSVQEEPSQIVIVPRLNYLTIRITGAAIDWHDAASRNPHGRSAGPSEVTANENALAANYARTHLVLEQGGQVLPLHVQSMTWRKLRENDDSSERFEIFLRADRPERLAASQLSVGSDLFSNLEKAATIIELGGVSKAVKGAETAEFSGSATLPSFEGDLWHFASAGLAQPITNLSSVIMIGVLLLGLSLLPGRYTLQALGAVLLGQNGTFLFELMKAPAGIASSAALIAALIVVILGIAAFLLARRPDLDPARAGGFLVAVALIGGLALGFSGVAPLRLWGLPERGLFTAGIAFTFGAATAQIFVALMLRTLLSRWQRKFIHQAQYGGMDWRQAVKIASLVLGILGGYFSLQTLV